MRHERTSTHRPEAGIHFQVGYLPVSTFVGPSECPLPGSLIERARMIEMGGFPLVCFWADKLAKRTLAIDRRWPQTVLHDAREEHPVTRAFCTFDNLPRFPNVSSLRMASQTRISRPRRFSVIYITLVLKRFELFAKASPAG
jgi:hypothetical protein